MTPHLKGLQAHKARKNPYSDFDPITIATLAGGLMKAAKKNVPVQPQPANKDNTGLIIGAVAAFLIIIVIVLVVALRN